MNESKFKIVNTNLKGRSLVANKVIAIDEVILEEAPFVCSQFSWNKAYGYLACENCMLPLETAEQNVRRLAFDPSIILPFPESDPVIHLQQKFVQCQECSLKFCSTECLEEAKFKYHSIMCHALKPNQPFDSINEIWKKMHYPPETTSLLLILRIFAMVKLQPEYLNVFGEFCDRSKNDDLRICHKILGKKFSEQLSNLHQALIQLFQGEEILSRFLTVEGFTQLFTMIGTNSQGIGTSPFANWVRNVSELQSLSEKQSKELDEFIDTVYATFDNTVGTFLNNEGSGLYVTQSKINHSCKPNAEIRFPFSNSKLQVVALREIKPDEEICISYLDECQLDRSRYSRQKYLQENYLFLCDCEKCQEEVSQADETSDDDVNDGDDNMDTDDD
ncbi:CLUMA_CG018232, isoform A [Clunio marinus]|uniref:CLUMA_CG018232, isoform A n=1 Tax=Clunio marinus TaxID=568069 RepID=A0A1J1J1A4_9DIPT|nr:CLUMA_CG018232, isoform A [Clunio marinus]